MNFVQRFIFRIFFMDIADKVDAVLAIATELKTKAEAEVAAVAVDLSPVITAVEAGFAKVEAGIAELAAKLEPTPAPAA